MYKTVLFILLLSLIMVLSSLPACTFNQEDPENGEVIDDLTGLTPPQDQPLTENPKLSTHLDYLIQAERRGEAEEFAKSIGIELIDGKVRVSVKCEYDMIEEATRAARRLGVVELEPIVRDDLVHPVIQMVIPITSLNDLAAEKSVKRIRLPAKMLETGD